VTEICKFTVFHGKITFFSSYLLFFLKFPISFPLIFGDCLLPWYLVLNPAPELFLWRSLWRRVPPERRAIPHWHGDGVVEDEGPDEAENELELAVDNVRGVNVDQGDALHLEKGERDGDILELLRSGRGNSQMFNSNFWRAISA
jgi:hypothetical protein